MIPELHPKTVEDLVIAIVNLRNSDGKHINLMPKDVLTDEMLAKMPPFFSEERRDGETFREFVERTNVKKIIVGE